MTTQDNSPRYQVQGTTLTHQDPDQAVADAIASMNPGNSQVTSSSRS